MKKRPGSWGTAATPPLSGRAPEFAMHGHGSTCMNLLINTANFGRLYVQTNARNDQLLVRKRKSDPYTREPRGERYYQIAARLPAELVPPQLGHKAIRKLQKSVDRLRDQTESLDSQIGQYTELADDRFDRVLENCSNAGIRDADRIDRAVANDPYMNIWQNKRKACSALLKRKSVALEGKEKELTTSIVTQMTQGARGE